MTTIIIYIILCLIWSSTWMVIKIGLETAPPFLSAGLRFLTAGALLLIYGLLTKHNFKFRFKTHLFFIFFGIINFTGGYALVYWGEQYINSGLASVLFAVMPFYVAFFAVFMLPDEKITVTKISGLILGFSGVLVIFRDQLLISSTDELLGMILVLISPIFSGIGTIIAKQKFKVFSPLQLNTLPILYCAISFFLLSLIFEPDHSIQFTGTTIFSFLYLGIMGTAVAFGLYFWMLRNQSAVMMSTITFVTPPMALLWGWFVLDEHITWFLLLGMVLIFSGILIIRK